MARRKTLPILKTDLHFCWEYDVAEGEAAIDLSSESAAKAVLRALFARAVSDGGSGGRVYCPQRSIAARAGRSAAIEHWAACRGRAGGHAGGARALQSGHGAGTPFGNRAYI